MIRLRHLIGLPLVLIVALQGAVMAGARGQAATALQAVICSGTTTVVISLDADGNPVTARHICPDYGLTLLSSAGLAEPGAEFHTTAFAASFAPAGRTGDPIPRRAHVLARGPPLA